MSSVVLLSLNMFVVISLINVLNSRNLAYSGPAKARHNILLVTRAGRLRVLKWAPFVFRIIIIILGVDFRSYADWFAAPS